MEKRIKALYIITIASILAFLGMQVYWLYGRYEASLGEQEDRILAMIHTEMDGYFNSYYNLKKNFNYITSYSISKSYDATIGPKTFNATIVWYDRNQAKYFPQQDSTKTEEENIKNAKNFLENNTRNIKKTYNVSNAPTEGEVWTAMQKADLEFEFPMTIDRMDSIMASLGIIGKYRLVELDTMVWDYSMFRHSSLKSPSAKVNIPYSELDRKIAEVEIMLPVGEVLKDMAGTLAIVVFLSTFLILCLVFQIRTVMRLNRIDKMRSMFITTMIHELKRPISTLKMCVSGLENHQMMKDVEMKRELMTETRNSLDNLSAYFSKLRDITFNNVEQIPLNIQEVYLRELFDEVTGSLIIPDNKMVEFINKIDEDLVISADRTHVVNILNNLVENAVKYSGSNVVIKAEANDNNGIVELRISDTGNGIPAGEMKHIFKRFFRGKAGSGEQPGMGLGLAYVKLLVNAHGGEITVESIERKGTCFTIKLPQ